MSECFNIVIADDHPLFRSALKQALVHAYPTTHWFEAESAASLNQILANQGAIDLIILDLQMPDSHGYSTLIHLRSHYPAIPVVVISAYEDNQTISKAMHYGCCGFIPKSTPMAQLTSALDSLLQGDNWLPAGFELTPQTTAEHDEIATALAQLTPQQYKVLQMFGEGLLNKQIAYKLTVSEATIKAHATAIFRKLNVRSRTQAVIALGQLELDKPAL